MSATKHRHGLVIGKFYPPHTGHLFLIDTAAAACEHLTVVVMAAAAESITLDKRVQWLRTSYQGNPRATITGIRCDVGVDLGCEPVWEANLAHMRLAVAHAHRHHTEPGPVTALFSSEGYGPELARRLHATHVAVDPARSNVPVRATQIRADLAGNWDHLPAHVRADLTTRVVFCGAESTGTTTISRDLAAAVRARGGVWERTAWVPEHGRDYTRAKLAALPPAPAGTDPLERMAGIVWTHQDFADIGTTQQQLEDDAAATGSPLLVADTDAFISILWERRYLGAEAQTGAWLRGLEMAPRAVYFITDPAGVPFVQDGIRDGEHLRAEMHRWFLEELTAHGHSWVLLTGTREERLRLALRTVDDLLTHTAALAAPLPDTTAATAAALAPTEPGAAA